MNRVIPTSLAGLVSFGVVCMSNWKFLWALLGCVVSLSIHAEARGDNTKIDLAPLIVVHANKSMQQALADLKTAIADNNYVYIREQNVDSRLTKTAYENDRVVFVYFCNFNLLNQALRIDSRVGVFLPCAITLIQRGNGVEMVAVNPKMISNKFNNARLNEICNKVSDDYRKILDEASL